VFKMIRTRILNDVLEIHNHNRWLPLRFKSENRV